MAGIGETLLQGEVTGTRTQHPAHRERLGDLSAVDRAAHQRPQEALLPLDPVEVLARQAGLQGDVVQRGLAVEASGPCGQPTRLTGYVDHDSAEQVDHLRERIEVDHGEPVQPHPGELLDGAGDQPGPTGGRRVRERARAEAGDVDDAVGRDREHVERAVVRSEVQHHHQVAAHQVVAPPGAVAASGRGQAGVAADQQDRRTGRDGAGLPDRVGHPVEATERPPEPCPAEREHEDDRHRGRDQDPPSTPPAVHPAVVLQAALLPEPARLGLLGRGASATASSLPASVTRSSLPGDARGPTAARAHAVRS